MPETYMSKCHEAEGDWMPEVGSPAYQRRWDGMHPTFEPEAVEVFWDVVKLFREKRAIIVPVPRVKGGQGVKFHWASNRMCGHIVKGWKDRVLDGPEFDAIAKGDRCMSCDYRYTNA